MRATKYVNAAHMMSVRALTGTALFRSMPGDLQRKLLVCSGVMVCAATTDEVVDVHVARMDMFPELCNAWLVSSLVGFLRSGSTQTDKQYGILLRLAKMLLTKTMVRMIGLIIVQKDLVTERVHRRMMIFIDDLLKARPDLPDDMRYNIPFDRRMEDGTFVKTMPSRP